MVQGVNRSAESQHRPASANIDAKIAALKNKISRAGYIGPGLRKDYLDLAKLFGQKGNPKETLHYALKARNTYGGYENQTWQGYHEANFLIADSLQGLARKADPAKAKELYAEAFATLFDESQGASGPLSHEYNPKLLKLEKEYRTRFGSSNIDIELSHLCEKKGRSETIAQLIEKAKPSNLLASIKNAAVNLIKPFSHQ